MAKAPETSGKGKSRDGGYFLRKNTVGHVPDPWDTFNILLYPLICICYVMYYYLIHCIEAKVHFYHFTEARNQTMIPLPWFSTDSEFIHETMPLLKVEWYYSLLWMYKKMLCLVTLPTRAEEAVVPFIYSFKEENWARCWKLSNFGMSCIDTS